MTPNGRIERIWPTPFDVIIDINLNFEGKGESIARAAAFERPDPCQIAKVLITKYIQEANLAAGVTGTVQSVDEDKTAISGQYVVRST